MKPYGQHTKDSFLYLGPEGAGRIGRMKHRAKVRARRQGLSLTQESVTTLGLEREVDAMPGPHCGCVDCLEDYP